MEMEPTADELSGKLAEAAFSALGKPDASKEITS